MKLLGRGTWSSTVRQCHGWESVVKLIKVVRTGKESTISKSKARSQHIYDPPKNKNESEAKEGVSSQHASFFTTFWLTSTNNKVPNNVNNEYQESNSNQERDDHIVEEFSKGDNKSLQVHMYDNNSTVTLSFFILFWYSSVHFRA